MKHTTTESTMLDALDALVQIEEAARGFREHCEREGWSPTAAEAFAATWLMEAIRKAMT